MIKIKNRIPFVHILVYNNFEFHFKIIWNCPYASRNIPLNSYDMISLKCNNAFNCLCIQAEEHKDRE